MASDEHRTTHSIEHVVLQDAGFSKFHIAIHLQFLIRADEIQISAPRKALLVICHLTALHQFDGELIA